MSIASNILFTLNIIYTDNCTYSTAYPMGVFNTIEEAELHQLYLYECGFIDSDRRYLEISQICNGHVHISEDLLKQIDADKYYNLIGLFPKDS